MEPDRVIRGHSSGLEMSSEKEREALEEAGDEEKEVKEEKIKGMKEFLNEELELEELRAQMLQLLLELEEAQDTVQKHEENFLELQGEIHRTHHKWGGFLLGVTDDRHVKRQLFSEGRFQTACPEQHMLLSEAFIPESSPVATLPCSSSLMITDRTVYHIYPCVYSSAFIPTRTRLLEEERLASAHQAEAFTRQIQHLQAQLRSVQTEIDTADEEKEGELLVAREELRAAEEAAAERENDIASLQEELCRLRAEISRLEDTGQEYELEMVTLRAEIEMKSQSRLQQRKEGDVGQLLEECKSLKEQCQMLQEENSRLNHRLQLLQKRSSGGSCVPLKEEEDETEASQTSISQMNCRLVDAGIQKNISFEGRPVTPSSWTGGFSEIFSLRDQLKQTEEVATHMQTECDGLRNELQNMREMYETSQKERAELELELLRFREEVERTTDGKEE
ncbi:hypothetical protein DNTS_011935 [Danionella cerebrum]|uniref:Uncharacterized protein n=1 Tax=Danionella cerebrum TaxID=2873325 RepID=A0A553Q7L2_9TELE|nr:hypothetical protein DNTS_011935 [Danionella translucida]TRY85923.1 hypothetical protein DNTS_011935 [Danionella translucida]